MAGIPRVLDTDAEDVIWALQTADALWKRGERVDAVVWLRRAAQSAGEAEDDDRALVLAREAAELAEWTSQNPAAALSAPPPTPPPTPGEAVDEFLRQSDDTDSRTPVMPPVAIDVHIEPPVVEERRAPPPPKPRHPSSARLQAVEPPSSARIERVPSAAEAHAGMLDPWADAEAPTRSLDAPAHAPPPPHAPHVAHPPIPATPPAPHAAPRKAAPQPPPHVAPPPPPPPPPPPAAAEFDSEEVLTSAPPVVSRPSVPEHPAVTAPKAPSPVPPHPQAPPPPRIAAPAPRAAPLAPASPAPPAPTPAADAAPDLSSVEALADLPDDAREAFGRAAVVHQLARDEGVSGFALALVIKGSADLSATIVDSAAQRLEAGAILRARGTVGPVASLRLVSASDHATVAVWDEGAVTTAFGPCPWVEDDLRAAGDRYQALVGVTMGLLGERLDPALRASVTDRLRLLTLAEHEVFASKGQVIPGLLVVGAGELELIGADGTPNGTVFRPGEFLFPNEVLRAAPAPETVRASVGGALILLAERGIAQELLVTCPPLLEIFAGA